jgi:hypothetical protein
MKITSSINTLLIFLFIGCKVQDAIITDTPNVFNNKHLNKQYEAIVSFNLKNEPSLLEEIESFKEENKNTALEDQVIVDFLALQICNQEAGVQFQDYPNALQPIFDFYNTMPKEDMVWLNDQKLKIIKFVAVRFIANYAQEMDAMDYLKNQLNVCKNDSAYAKVVISSYDLNECAEKRR